MIDSSNITISKLNECYFNISTNSAINKELDKYFAIFSPNYKHSKLWINHFWDGKKRFYSLKYSTLPIGLHKQLTAFISKNKYTIKIDIPEGTFSDSTITKESIETLFKKYVSNPKIEIRDYQIESVFQALSKKRGILLNATGSGKTIVLYLLARKLLEDKEKILIVVPSISLVSQFSRDIKKYGWEEADDFVAQFHGQIEKDYSKPIIISTYQSLVSEEKEFFEKFNSIFVDECHKAKASSIEFVLKNAVNAKNRIGLTGSLPKDNCDLMSVMSQLGPVIHEIKTKELQDKGILAKSTIKIMKIKYSDNDREDMFRKSFKREMKFVKNSQERNKVFDYIFQEIGKDSNSIVFFLEVEHLRATEEYLRKNFPDKKFYVSFGKTKLEERDEIIAITEREKGVTILASYGAMSTGISINNLNTLIFFGMIGKSEIRIIQSFGRGTRLADDKNSFELYDIVDELCWKDYQNYLYKQYLERALIYKEQELEFKEIDFVLT